MIMPISNKSFSYPYPFSKVYRFKITLKVVKPYGSSWTVTLERSGYDPCEWTLDTGSSCAPEGNYGASVGTTGTCVVS